MVLKKKQKNQNCFFASLYFGANFGKYCLPFDNIFIQTQLFLTNFV